MLSKNSTHATSFRNYDRQTNFLKARQKQIIVFRTDIYFLFYHENFLKNVIILLCCTNLIFILTNLTE